MPRSRSGASSLRSKRLTATVSASRSVEIIPLGWSGDVSVEALSVEVRRHFGLPCRITLPEALPADARDARRGQYHSTRLLQHLADSPSHAFRRLGVVEVDLFVPILTFLFGEAMLGGRAGVVSVHRLGSGDSRSPEDHLRRSERLMKEGIHELGHTFDLTHCEDRACVMSTSRDVPQIDLKGLELCRYCQVTLADCLARG